MPRISDFPIKSNPSTAANLSAVDGGENVQIPTSVFQNQIDYINMVIREDLIEYDDAVINGGQTDPVNISSPQTVIIRNNGEVYNPNAIIMDPNTGISLSSDEGVNINSYSISIMNSADQEAGLAIEGRSTDLHSVRKLYAKDDDEGLDTMPAGCVLTSGDGSKIRWSNDYVHSDTLDDKLLNKVDKVSGKGLSTNDYTTAEKNKLAGLAAVATSGSYNDLTDKPTIPSGGGSGGGASIIDIEEFPSEPSTTSIYRKWQVVKAVWVYANTSSGSLETTIATDGTMECEVVNTLPEVGNACYSGESMYAYYQRTDGEVYGYVDSILSSAMGVPVGWYPAATLFSALGFTYNGMIDSIEDVTEGGYYALVTRKPHLYQFYNDSKGNIVKSAIITNDNYDFNETTGTLTQIIVL